MSIHSRLLFTALALLAISACNRRAPAAPEGPISDFAAFYERFHRDSLYQMEHIPFPIDGLPTFSDKEDEDLSGFRWTAENWKLHRPLNLNQNEFKQTFDAIGENLIVESIIHRNGSFAMMRRFARMGDEWYLIYYAAMNPAKTAQ